MIERTRRYTTTILTSRLYLPSTRFPRIIVVCSHETHTLIHANVLLLPTSKVDFYFIHSRGHHAVKVALLLLLRDVNDCGCEWVRMGERTRQ